MGGIRGVGVVFRTPAGRPPLTVIASLTHLKKLRIFRSRLTDISFLEGLSNLTSLNLSSNNITDYSFLEGLSNLTSLNLSSNNITDYSFLEGLSNLTTLDLTRNEVTDISFLECLSNLQYVMLWQNNIIDIPEELLKLGLDFDVDSSVAYSSEKKIFLYLNPIETPPIEIVKKGRTAVRDYFDALKKEENKPLKEVKVLLVGDGAAGKTSLVKRILKKGFDKHEIQTDGIAIEAWKPPKTLKSNDSLNIRLWDFGGQEIMHATHQFFLSKRSLYILVLDGRKDEKTEYWLKHIETFGAGSPVHVVINKIDQNPGFEVNRKFLQEKYNNIKGFHRVSCKENEGVGDLKKALLKSLSQMDMLNTPWPKSWFHIKTHLENMTEHYISYREYRDICGQYKQTEQSKQDTLLDYLNDLGVILHFKRLELKDLQVLEPKWVTEAVYKIINSGKVTCCNGILSLDALDTILQPKDKKDYGYPPETYRYIVGLMKKFELCYPLDEEDSRVLIPDLLPVEESGYEFDFESPLKFVIRYDFLPRSVMPRFIVRMHRDIKDEFRWRTGVVLEDRGLGATAVVKSDQRERKITIEVGGEQKRDYFSYIRQTFRDINASFEKLKTTELVPLPDNDEIDIEYDELIGLETMRKQEFAVGRLKKTYSVSQLLDGIERKEERMKETGEKGINILNINQMNSNPNISPTISPTISPAIEVKPVNKQQVKVTTTATQTNEQMQEFNISVDLPTLQKDFARLKRLLSEQNSALEPELREIGDSWDELLPTDEKDTARFAKPMNKMTRLIEDFKDEESELRQTLHKTQKGIQLVQKVGRTYNKFAQWLALPQVPDVLLGK